MHALVPRPGSCASIAPTPSAHTALPAAIILAIVGAFMWFRRRHKKRKRLLAQAPHQPPAAGAPTGEAGSPSFALGAAKLDDMLDSAECGGGTPGAASKAGAVGSVAISAAAAGVAPYAGSDGGTTAASSRIRAVTPQSPYGMQGVADLWAAAAAHRSATPCMPYGDCGVTARMRLLAAVVPPSLPAYGATPAAAAEIATLPTAPALLAAPGVPPPHSAESSISSSLAAPSAKLGEPASPVGAPAAGGWCGA